MARYCTSWIFARVNFAILAICSPDKTEFDIRANYEKIVAFTKDLRNT